MKRALMIGGIALAIAASHRCISVAQSSRSSRIASEAIAFGDVYTALLPDLIYWGDATAFSRPAVLAARKVYERIPPYQRILEEGLDPDNPRYWTLLKEADKIFRENLLKFAAGHSYDVIGERGAIVSSVKSIRIDDVTSSLQNMLGQ